MNRTTVLVLLGLFVTGVAAENKVWSVVEAVKVKNQYHDEALFYYQHNWRQLRLEALKRGYIDSFHLLESAADETADFDLLLTTNYASQQQLQQAEKHFDKLIAESGGLKLLNEVKPKDFRQRAYVKIGKSTTTAKHAASSIPFKEVVMDGLARPWSMAFLNEHEALVSEKDGDLVKVNLITKQKIPIQNFPDDLVSTITVDTSKYEPGIYPESLQGRSGSFNMGIFDVVLDPNFADNRFVYVAYAARKKDTFTTKVIRAKLMDNSLLDVAPIFVANPYTAGAWHFGGGLAFAPDNTLLITIGERLFNEINQPAMPIAQNLQDKRGKIHRINADGTIPKDNPVFDEQAISSIYALGIRAAQGLTVHPTTGDIWFTEHGTNQGDEINILTSGANYGWPIKTTGTYRFAEYQPPKLSHRRFTVPAWYWQRTVAPTGLTFYTGSEFPEWQNNLLVPGLSKGSLWRVSITGKTVRHMEELFVDSPVRARKVVQSPQGKLYLLTDEINGKIVRIGNKKS